MASLGFIKSNLRWLLGGLVLTIFSSFGQTFFISLFSDDIRAKFSLTDGQFGMLYMVATLVSALTLVYVGKVVDRFSIANCSAGVIVCLAVVCASMSIVTSVVALFLCLYAVRLLGQGMMTHVSQTAMGRWYDVERGKAISFTSLGHNLGEAALPAAVLFLTLSYGWQSAWQAAAAVLLIAALPVVYFTLRVAPSLNDVETATAKVMAAPVDSSQRQWSRKQVLRDGLFYLVGLGILAPAFIATAFYFHQKHLLEVKGWAEELYASAFLVLAVTSIAAKLIAGWLIDRVGAIRILPLFLVFLAASCFILAAGEKEVAIYFAVINVGLAMGFCNSTLGAVWPEIYGVKHLGSIRALAFAGVVVASALGPGVTGWLIDLEVSIERQFFVMGIYSVFGIALMWFVSRRLRIRIALEG